MSSISYKPEDVWRQFFAIVAIPRCSGDEAAVLSYIEEKANQKKYECKRDAIGNLVVKVPGQPRYENSEAVVIQGHVDIVCEKNRGCDHDFTCDPIKWIEEEGWIKAPETTLGADNGIAVAFMLALITGEYEHGPLELLFTVDEETGLTGALEFDPSLISGKKMINIDSEDEGHICIGCAGGITSIGHIPIEFEVSNAGLVPFHVSVTGLTGGHSGMDIVHERGNSIQLAARVAAELLKRRDVQLVDIKGGDKHNAIPRECFVSFYGSKEKEGEYAEICINLQSVFRDELKSRDREVDITLAAGLFEGAVPSRVLVKSSAHRLINLILAFPHGVLGMSQDVEGIPETSSNLAAVNLTDSEAVVMSSQRSASSSQRDLSAQKIAALVELAGGTMEYDSIYPAWSPNTESPLLKASLELYKQYSIKEPLVEVIHAGLECGVIGDKIDGMDMISIGPDIHGVHGPGERVNIGSVERVWNFFLALLKKIA